MTIKPLTPQETSDTHSVADRLRQHYEQVSNLHMPQLFAEDPDRFSNFSLEIDGLLLDYSKNRISDETLSLLFEFAREKQIEAWRERQFSGEKINFTEDRAVLHTALRNQGEQPVIVDGQNVIPKVHAELEHMADFASRVHRGDWRGYTGQPITDIVNIGIGGSDLGPKMVCQALQPYQYERLNMHFVSHVDAVQIESAIKHLNPATTLFIIVSKTFSTQETLTNAQTARQWLLDHFQTTDAISHHFVAVSTNQAAVEEFGINPQNMFVFWDWVGGRYSLWSAVGLSIMLAIGEKNFRQLLQGAYAMDRHFQETPLERNMPVILALIGYWYRQYFNTTSHVLLPYDYLLRALPAYMQQADMESNGKSTDRHGNHVNYPTADVLWGDSGINGQHSFYQLLHQGTQIIPVDFIASIKGKSKHPAHHDIMFSNVIAQGEALMHGRTEEETREILNNRNVSEERVEQLLPHMIFEGNRPSNTLLLDEITPHSLGMLIALYEHKIFVQGVLWDINSYDQWGVELGKQLAGHILPQLDADQPINDHDQSTNSLINYYRQHAGNKR
jgi:glucose-6-phosphate isomerase